MPLLIGLYWTTEKQLDALQQESGQKRPQPPASADDTLPALPSSDTMDVVSAAPPVGRTRAVEILRGGRSKVIVQYAYDRLAGYGAFAHLRSSEVLGRIDGLLSPDF